MNLPPEHAKVPPGPPRVEPASAEPDPLSSGRFAMALAWWVERARRLAWPIIVGAVALTAVAGTYTVDHLGMNTDSNALLSSDLPYRKNLKEYEKEFPQLQDNLVVVIEADSPDRAEDAANALADRLRGDHTHFTDVFSPNGDPFFRREGLLFLEPKELQDLSDRLAQAQPLLAALVVDRSLRGLFGVLGEAAQGIELGEVNPNLLVRPLTMIGDIVEERLEGKPARLSWRDLMTGLPDRASDRRQIITLKPRLDYQTLDPAAAAIATVHDDAKALDLDAAHGVSVRVTGGPAMDEDQLKSVQKGVGLASAVSLVLVTGLVFVGLRSPKLVFATIATLLMSLVWTAGFATVSIGYLNLISVAFAVLFIGLAVDFSIQFGLRYRESIDQGADNKSALGAAAAGTGIAVGLAALCAAIGFFAFVPTQYIGLAQLGIIAGTGMFIGLFATLTLLPALLTVMPVRPSRRAGDDKNGHPMTSVLERHSRAVCLGALALGLVSLAALPFVTFDIDPVHLQDPNTESVKAYIELTKDSTTSPYSISVVTPNLAAADALAHRLDKLPEVDSTVTLSSFLPQDQNAKLALIDQMATFLTPVIMGGESKPPPNDAERRAAVVGLERDLGKLAASPKAGPVAAPARRLADLLERYQAGPGSGPDGDKALGTALIANLAGRLEGLIELMQAGPVTYGTLPPNLKARYLAPDGRARVEVFPAEQLNTEDSLTRFVDSVSAIAPNATDTPVLLLGGGRLVIGAFERAGAIAFVAISLLLLVVLKSFWDSLLVLLPLALAAALTVATVVVTGQSFNFANIIALPLLFSLGVAFGIYLVLRHRETRRVADLLRTSTPRAVLFSALTTMTSFSSLMLSSHRGTASMGYLLGICLTLALVCTLVVLPALLTWREQRRAARYES
ncbi:MAG TPA: MMPL family transporter [Alphaproteobacteria bacterium]|nr:MMPL family transporter [Alphaproteobacteria bacterium]